MKRKKLHVVDKPENTPMPSLDRITAFARQAEQTPATPKAEPPRDMTREHRRIIFAKLEEVYIDEVSGYSAGWTDDRVAKDLGVPRAWVSTIREENFGPDSSAELLAAVSEAKICVEAAGALRKEMDQLAARGAEILKRADAIERTVKRIETAIR